MIDLGQNLNAARRLAALTGDQMAERIGLSRQTVHHYESGRRVPNSATLIAWAEACGCSVDCLMSSSSLWRRLLQAEQCLNDLAYTEDSLFSLLGKRNKIRARRRP